MCIYAEIVFLISSYVILISLNICYDYLVLYIIIEAILPSSPVYYYQQFSTKSCVPFFVIPLSPLYYTISTP